jgi:hypothetical protein
MAIQSTKQDNLGIAFGLFIEAFKPYVVEILSQVAGEKWPDWLADALYPHQKDTWNQGLRAGLQPESLIDYPQLKGFASKYKDLLRADFGMATEHLPSTLDAIYQVRKKVAHSRAITDDEYALTFFTMRIIARAIAVGDLEEALANLQEAKSQKEPYQKPEAKSIETASGNLLPWFRLATPQVDIRQGRRDDSVFAPNLAEVAFGNEREMYGDPALFFSRTVFTAGLRTITRTVLKGLNGNEDPKHRVISLQSGSGVGKTHTLISLYHLAKWGKRAINLDYTKDLFAYTGVPEFETANIAIFSNTTNDPANGRRVEEGIHVKTIWGELAYQLGGREAFEIVRKEDERLFAPDGVFKQVLEKCQPALILVDGLAEYCVKASAQRAGCTNLADQTIAFLQELTEAVSASNNCVVVIALPTSMDELDIIPKAQSILMTLQKRISGFWAGIEPLADDEIYEVVRRRVFEDIADRTVIEEVVSRYLDRYEAYWFGLPSDTNRSAYIQKFLRSYPFQPEFFDLFRGGMAGNQGVRSTRDVLKLVAAVVGDLWERRQSLRGENALIHRGVANVVGLDALLGLPKKR